MAFSTIGTVTVLTWDEDITLKNVEVFREQMNELCEAGTRLILNIRGVNYMNSNALGIIATSVTSSKTNGKELIITHVENSVAAIFDVVKFSMFITFFETLDEAIRHFEG